MHVAPGDGGGSAGGGGGGGGCKPGELGVKGGGGGGSGVRGWSHTVSFRLWYVLKRQLESRNVWTHGQPESWAISTSQPDARALFMTMSESSKPRAIANMVMAHKPGANCSGVTQKNSWIMVAGARWRALNVAASSVHVNRAWISEIGNGVIICSAIRIQQPDGGVGGCGGMGGGVGSRGDSGCAGDIGITGGLSGHRRTKIGKLVAEHSDTSTCSEQSQPMMPDRVSNADSRTKLSRIACSAQVSVCVCRLYRGRTHFF